MQPENQNNYDSNKPYYQQDDYKDIHAINVATFIVIACLRSAILVNILRWISLIIILKVTVDPLEKSFTDSKLSYGFFV